MIRLRRVRPQIDGKLGLDPQQVAPLHGPVIRKLLPLQQPVDQGPAFLRVRVLQELSRLLRGGQRPDDVQINASDEHSIGADIGRWNAQPLQPAENQLVDLVLGRQSGLAFKRVRCRAGCCGSTQGRQQHNDRN